MVILDDALKTVSDHYNISIKALLDVLESNFKSLSDSDNRSDIEIILPFCNHIYEDCCRGIIFNHGLYTQCKTKLAANASTDICKKCINLSYGRIEERMNIKKNEFISKKGKKEVPYETFMKKMGYTYQQVKYKLDLQNLTYNFSENIDSTTEPRRRGRPKNTEKISDEDDDDTISVTKIIIDGILYYKTEEGVILSTSNYEIIGVYNKGKIEKIK